MKRHHGALFAIFSTILLLVILFPVQASSQPSEKIGNDYVHGEIIVKMKSHSQNQIGKFGALSVNRGYNTLSMETANSLVSKDVAINDVEKLPLDNAYVLRFSSQEEMEKIIKTLENDSNVEYAQPNYIYHILAMPNDPSFSGNQWALQKINASSAWDISTGNSSVVIAIVDSGVEYNHSDLAANIWNNTGEILGNGADDDGNGFVDDVYGWNFNGSNNNTMDDNGHGTHVAGIAAAVSNNSVGVAGVCWNCKIMPVKVTDSDGITTSSQLASGINYSAQMNASIISISIGGTSNDSIVKDAIDYAYGRGSIIIAAAGNEGQSGNPIMYPAAYDNVIAVAATNNTDGRASYSEHGNWVDISAPGGDNLTSTIDENNWILSTYKDNSYAIGEGTSMAAPFVSGVIGLMLSANPSLKYQDIVTILNSTSDYLVDTGMGAGRINAYRALGGAINYSNVSSCRNFSISNRSYSLTGNISSSGTCINILADNVTLDCHGYAINYSQSSMGYGINVSGYNRTRIINCIISNGLKTNSHAAYFQDSWNSSIENASIITLQNSSMAIVLNHTSNFSITNSSAVLYGNYSNGIFSRNSSFVIANATVMTHGNGTYGMDILYSNSSSMRNLWIETSNDISNGMEFVLSENFNISNSTIITYGYMSDALVFNSSTGLSLNNVSVTAHGQYSNGVRFHNNSDSNTLANSMLSSNQMFGIYMENLSGIPDNNTIYNCLLNGSILPVNFSSGFPADATNYWNSSRQSGTRFYTNGHLIGGNYYTNSTGNGFSDSCVDVNETGFCDQFYDISANTNCTECGNNTDYLVMGKDYNFPPILNNISMNSSDILNRKNTTLGVNYSLNDSDNQTVFLIIKWYKNGTEQIGFENQTNITQNNLTKGDNWSYSVGASDGISWHGINGWVWNSSANITIQNAAPDLNLISPANGTTFNHTVAFSWNGSDIDSDNLTYNFTINGTLDNTTIYGNASNISDNHTSLVLFAGHYNWSVLAYDNESTTQKNGSFYVNDTIPSIGYSTWPPIVINGSNVTLAINVTNIIPDAIWANITLPDASSERISMTSNTPLNYTNTTMNGTYTVTFFANNTFGNLSNATTSFNSSSPLAMNVTITNTSGAGIANNVTIIYNNYVIASNTTQGGTINQQVPNSTYVVYVKSYGNNLSMTFWSVNFSANNTMLLGIDKPTISGYNVTYAVNYNLTGTAALVINYTGAGIANENYLGLYKCDPWNFTSRNCSGTWTNITGSASKDTTLHTLSFSVTGFSAFAIKQETYCGNAVCDSGETSSSCSADCGTSGSSSGSDSSSSGIITTTTEVSTTSTTIEEILMVTTTFEEPVFNESSSEPSNETITENQAEQPLLIDWFPFFILIAIGSILATAYFVTNKIGINASMEKMLINKSKCYKDLVILEKEIMKLKECGYDTTKIDNEAVLAKRSIDSEAFNSAKVHINNARSLLDVYRKKKR